MHLSLIGFFFAASIAFSSTANASERPSDRTACMLPADQGPGSFAGSWDSLPITLVFDRAFYRDAGGAEATALRNAVGTWNAWAKLRGLVAFKIAKEGRGLDIPKNYSCDQTEYTRAMPNMVGVWKLDGAKDRKNDRATCGGGKLVVEPAQVDWDIAAGKIRGASILFNFEDFNSAGKPTADLESLMLQDLGYVLGLMHSCNGSGLGKVVDATSAPACGVAPAEYLDAVMAPFSPGTVRRSLSRNDFNRVNCLY